MAPRSQGRAAEADTWIHFCRLPGWGGDGRRGWKLRTRRTSFPLPSLSPQAELQAYMVKEKNNKENV